MRSQVKTARTPRKALSPSAVDQHQSGAKALRDEDDFRRVQPTNGTRPATLRGHLPIGNRGLISRLQGNKACLKVKFYAGVETLRFSMTFRLSNTIRLNSGSQSTSLLL